MSIHTHGALIEFSSINMPVHLNAIFHNLFNIIYLMPDYNEIPPRKLQLIAD